MSNYKEDLIFRLVSFANTLGYGVDFKSMEGEGTPSGLCVTAPKETMIYIRAGKKINGRITSLIHEIAHAVNRKNDVFYIGHTAKVLEEWECESVAHFVTQLIGIDRRKQTTAHVLSYVGQPVFCTNDNVTSITRDLYAYLTA